MVTLPSEPERTLLPEDNVSSSAAARHTSLPELATSTTPLTSARVAACAATGPYCQKPNPITKIKIIKNAIARVRLPNSHALPVTGLETFLAKISSALLKRRSLAALVTAGEGCGCKTPFRLAAKPNKDANSSASSIETSSLSPKEWRLPSPFRFCSKMSSKLFSFFMKFSAKLPVFATKDFAKRH